MVEGNKDISERETEMKRFDSSQESLITTFEGLLLKLCVLSANNFKMCPK